MSKKNIRISRYLPGQNIGFEAYVEPEDRAWVLFVPSEQNRSRSPQLFHRVGSYTDEKGDSHDSYAADGSPEHQAFMAEPDAGPCGMPLDEPPAAS